MAFTRWGCRCYNVVKAAYLKDIAKDVFLHFSIVHSDGTAPNLDPIYDKIVVLASNLVHRTRIALPRFVPIVSLNVQYFRVSIQITVEMRC